MSSLALPKMVIMQIIKNNAKNLDKASEITDNVLLEFVNNLSDSQFAKLLKIIQKKLDEKNSYMNDPNDIMNSPVIDNGDDYIAVGVTPVTKSDGKLR